MGNKKFNIKLLIIYILICILCFFYINYSVKNEELDNKDNFKNESITDTITILATGDIMFHMIEYINNYSKETGKYSFDTFYEKMKPYFDEADIVAGNYETTSNPQKSYSGFPCFNTPPESIEYLKNIGFDVLSTANNHCIDTGVEGIISTIDIMDKNNIKHFGTYKQKQDRGIIIEVNNIKVGFLGYSEIFNGMDFQIPEDKKYMISYFNVEQINHDVKTLKDNGADIIICYAHWGKEYSKYPDDFQKFMNHVLLNSGIDIVLGSHPHTLQRSEISGNDVNKKFTIYSMGNSISNQRRELIKKDGTESGVFVKLKITKIRGSNRAYLDRVDLIPTYVNRYRENGKYMYEVMAYQDIIEGGKYRSNFDEKTKNKIDEYYKNALDILYSVGE